MNKALEIEHGKKIADDAENIWGWGTPAGRLRAERRFQYLVRYGGIKKGKRALELGCGTGVFSEKLMDKGVKLVAIDISMALIQKARNKMKGRGVEFVVADIERLPFKQGVFDSVVGISVLHHLSLDIACREIYTVLKNGGSIACSEPNMVNPQICLQKNIPYLKRLLGDSPDETAYTRWQVNKALTANGFKNCRVFLFDFLHPLISPGWISFIEKLGRWGEKVPLIREVAGSIFFAGEK